MNLHLPGQVVLSALAGSHAYGLNTPESDEDFRGVFVADKSAFYSQNFPLEVSDESNDQSYFELEKFKTLLLKANPTVLEFLAFPEENIRERHELFHKFKAEDYLTKQCLASYTGYALGQIRKAYNLKKRISIPEEEELKSFLEFCYVLENGGKVPLNDSNINVNEVTASAVDVEKGIYSLWSSNGIGGLELNSQNEIITSENTEDEFKGFMVFDKLAYTKYLKEYQSFFRWKSDRVKAHKEFRAGEYDGKFLMHTFRLLFTAKDIVQKGELFIRRPERDFLLGVRSHEYEFGELIQRSEDLVDELKELFKATDLPNKPNTEAAEEAVRGIRDFFYSKE